MISVSSRCQSSDQSTWSDSRTEQVDYISLFSGIGGLEHSVSSPRLLCEVDPACQGILAKRFPDIPIHGDVATLTRVPRVNYVVGGWPCQDISSAGKLGGIGGSRSGLFFEMLRIAKAGGAHTLIGENVPNLLTINKGHDFERVVSSLGDVGFRHVTWRILDARDFGLPQERRRLFIVASTHKEHAMALHAATDSSEPTQLLSNELACGFYWTGGARSICFSKGYSPTLKIGATDNKGRAPVAVYTRGLVRKLTAKEFLGLQGFPGSLARNYPSSAILRMAGNAVAAPVGRFVMDSVTSAVPAVGLVSGYGRITESGYYDGTMYWSLSHKPAAKASNLHAFLDSSAVEPLSSQAAAGLLVRSVRSGKTMPLDLFETLLEMSKTREKLHPSRGNSFVALDEMQQELKAYGSSLIAIEEDAR